jgi:phosphate transport system protein
MARQFDLELKDLTDGLTAMAGRVEEMVDLAHQALLERDVAKAAKVNELDRFVDQEELRLDQMCVDLLALRGPIATDLRLIASTLKIIPELERIGDHCCNIARRAEILGKQPWILNGDYLERIGQETRIMVGRAMDAFVTRDASMARSVIEADDKVDELYSRIFRELLKLMLADPLTIERASHLILVIKNWERIADQATNIAEEVLYILEGQNVKHPYLKETP